MEKTDIVVIGASPAGLMAARYAALGGANVVLYEKKEEIGVPSHPANSFYKGMMTPVGEKADDAYIRHHLKGMKLISPSGHTIPVETPGYAIDKEKFDRFYAEKTEKAGVEIRCGHEITGLSRTGGTTVLKVRKAVQGDDAADRGSDNGSADRAGRPVDPETSPAEKIEADVVIIADGICSGSAQAAGLRTMKHPEDIAWGTELEIRAPGIGREEFAEYFVGSHAPGWKSTYLPMGNDSAAIGVYVRRHGKDTDDFLEPWIDRICRMKDIDRDEMEIVTRKSAGDPIVTIPDQIYAPGIMVAGGAAGQSGIGYAMRAGQIAGEVAGKAVSKGDFSKKVLSEYESRWRKDLWTEHVFGRIGLETLRKLDDDEIDDLFAVFEGEDVSSLIRGNTFGQGLSVIGLMLRKKPSAVLKAGAFFRNR